MMLCPPSGRWANRSQGAQACRTASLCQRGVNQASRPAVTSASGTRGWARLAGSKSAAAGTPATATAIRGSL